MHLQNDQTLLFIGDSITDCGRERPVGAAGYLGDGYVQLVQSQLAAAYPERAIKILNAGISGNRITDLESRWQSDVLDLKPQWLSIMIGINDVWRHFDDAANPDQVSVEYYESALRTLIAETQPSLEGLVLMTPFFLEPDRADSMRVMMDAYGAVVRKVAGDVGAILVDTQAAFDAYLAHRPSTTLCDDRVHPNQIGHMVLARAFLSEVEFR